MLATTVSYLSLLENKRHNLKTESQQDVQLSINQQEANIHAGQLAETIRHNKETESISWGNLSELQRHNVVTEGINQFDATTRRLQLGINQYEAETHRYSAIQNAGIGWANVAVNQGQLEVARQRTENDYDIGIKNATSQMRQATVAERRQSEEVRYHNLTNAVERTRNELTAQQNEIRQQELDWKKDIEQQRADIERTDMIWSNTNQSVDTARKIFDSVVNATDTKNKKKRRRP